MGIRKIFDHRGNVLKEMLWDGRDLGGVVPYGKGLREIPIEGKFLAIIVHEGRVEC